MANADVIYAIAVQGAEDAVKAFGKVGAATKSVEVAQDNMAAKANHYADAFKKVSRDIGTVGGQAAQAFTHIADEALSVVGMLTGGGLTAALAGVGLGVGAVVLAYKAWNDETTESKRIADHAVESHNKLLASAKKNADDAFASTTRMNAEQLRRVSIEKQLLVVALQLDQQKRLVEAAAEEGNAKNRAIAMAKIRKESDEEIAKASKESEVALGKFNVAQARATEMEVTRVKLDEQKERADKAKKAEESRAKEGDDEARKFKDGERAFYDVMNARARAYEKDKDAKLKADQEGRNLLEQAYQINAASDEENAKKVADALEKQRQAAQKLREERQKLNEEIRKTLLLGAGEQAFSASYGAGMFVIGNATSFASGQLKEFGNINRDNWRDTLAMTEDKKAAFLAEAQAALFNMGVQAGVKSFFEQAEALKETALMFGSLAMNDPKGVAAHGAAAAGHAVAAGAYSVIAVGGAGASLGIGAMRGGGGLAAAGPGAGGGRSGPSPSGGSAAGPRAPGASDGGGATNITFVYEAGSINAADERATARTVANGVGAARGSWFERRRMERRV